MGQSSLEALAIAKVCLRDNQQEERELGVEALLRDLKLRGGSNGNSDQNH